MKTQESDNRAVKTDFSPVSEIRFSPFHLSDNTNGARFAGARFVVSGSVGRLVGASGGGGVITTQNCRR